MSKIISGKAFERLKFLAGQYDPDEDGEAYYDAATWGNVDDSMSWAESRAEQRLATELLQEITNA